MDDFEPISPDIEHRIAVIISKCPSQSNYFSRSSTMVDDDEEEGIKSTMSVNWENSLATGGACLSALVMFIDESEWDE